MLRLSLLCFWLYVKLLHLSAKWPALVSRLCKHLSLHIRTWLLTFQSIGMRENVSSHEIAKIQAYDAGQCWIMTAYKMVSVKRGVIFLLFFYFILLKSFGIVKKHQVAHLALSLSLCWGYPCPPARSRVSGIARTGAHSGGALVKDPLYCSLLTVPYRRISLLLCCVVRFVHLHFTLCVKCRSCWCFGQ